MTSETYISETSDAAPYGIYSFSRMFAIKGAQSVINMHEIGCYCLKKANFKEVLNAFKFKGALKYKVCQAFHSFLFISLHRE